MSVLPPLDAQTHLFTAVIQQISALNYPIYAIRAPADQTPPYIVLRLQDDVRGRVYTQQYAATTTLSIVAVATTSQQAYTIQSTILPLLHHTTLTQSGLSFFLTWERTLPLEYFSYYSAISLYRVAVL